MQVVEITAVQTLPSGKLHVVFGDGTGLLFDNFDNLKEYIKSLEEDPSLAKKLLLGWWVARDADGSNPNLVTGKRLTLDMTSPNPIKVQ